MAYVLEVRLAEEEDLAAGAQGGVCRLAGVNLVEVDRSVHEVGSPGALCLFPFLRRPPFDAVPPLAFRARPPPPDAVAPLSAALARLQPAPSPPTAATASWSRFSVIH